MPLLTDFLRSSCARNSEKTAVKEEDSSISYKGLDELSGRIAACLAEGGVNPGDRIGICMGRSVHAVAAVFGALKCGAAYVPIEPTFPPERKAFIIKDCGVQAIVAEWKKLSPADKTLKAMPGLKLVVAPDAPDSAGAKNIKVATGDKIASKEPLKKKPAVKGGSLACILYTSGSTGRPKGVMMTHDALYAAVTRESRFFRLKDTDRISCTVPLYFSMSPFEIFATIGAGGALCVAPAGSFAFPSSLAGWIEREKITVWHSVPLALTQLVLYGKLEKRDLSFLRLVYFGGDIVPAKYLRKMMKALPWAEFYNTYGSAETQGIARYRTNDLDRSALTVPAGRKWDDVELILTDSSGKRIAVKKGASGELYVKSPSLMKGYWNRRDKTESALIDDPFGPKRAPGSKVYRTSDMARIDKDGNLIILGRVDDAINRDGYKIGLGEIEAALLDCADIKEAAVVAAERAGKKTIRAVITPGDGKDLSGEDIIKLLRRHLPRYMVPDIVEVKKTLPRTLTGKTDRTRA